MAVQVQFFCIIIRKIDIEAHYHGGLEQYKNDCPNDTYLEDAHLTSIGFMDDQWMYEVMAEIADKSGMSIATETVAGEIVPYHYGLGMFAMGKCDWLEKGRIGAVGYVYMTGTEPGDLVQLSSTTLRELDLNWY